MKFAEHSVVEGSHAFLSPSYYHWLGYTDEKVIERLSTYKEAARGTRLHSLAQQLITEGIALPDTKQTLNRYVNDAIRFGMTPEQILFYSYNCYGTADTIKFSRNLLRIHDLKTGKSRVSMAQLEIYAALFCLEYGFKPGKIRMELRIYKDDEVMALVPEVDEIAHIMDRIIHIDKLVTDANKGGL